MTFENKIIKKMKYFFILVTICLSTFTLNNSKKSYLCRKESSKDKDQKDLTINDCLKKIDGEKCCLVKIDQKDIAGVHKLCAKVEGDVNKETIKKIKEDLDESTDVSIDCSSSFLKYALVFLLITTGFLF